MNGWKTPPRLFTCDMKDGSRCARNQLGQTQELLYQCMWWDYDWAGLYINKPIICGQSTRVLALVICSMK